MPGLSIITINYNNKVGLEKTFASVFGQVFTDFEYVIIDGGSTDGSTVLITQNESRITRWISEKDNGIYDAMNKGISLVTGAYLIFLNSGDCFCDPETLKCCMKYLLDFPEADILYANIYMVHNYNQDNKELHSHPAQVDLAYLKENVLNHQASLFRAELFKEFGMYPTQYKLAGDYWLYLKSFFANKIFRFMDFTMIDFDSSGLSLTAVNKYNNEMNMAWELVVPIYVRQLVVENETLKKITQYKIVKIAIKLNGKYQRLKRIFK